MNGRALSLSLSLLTIIEKKNGEQFKKLLTPGKIGQIICLGNLTDRDTFEFLRGIAPDLQLVKGDFDVDAPNLPLSKVITPGTPGTANTGTTATATATATSSASTSGAGAGAGTGNAGNAGNTGNSGGGGSGLRIGFTHGHTIVPPADPDALLIAARQMDVDVLLWGGTHRFEAYELEGRFFVNPGSATGAFTTHGGAAAGGKGEPVPSFCLMDVCFPSSNKRKEKEYVCANKYVDVGGQVQGDVLVLYVYQIRTDDQGAETVSVEKVSFRKQSATPA